MTAYDVYRYPKTNIRNSYSMIRNLFVLTLLLLVNVLSLGAQQTSISLVVENSQKQKLTLMFGVHPKATYCLDAELGEMEMPPVPPTILFEARFLETRKNSTCFGNGTYKDFRKLISPAQIDTYKITINPGENAFPLKLHWNPIKKWFNRSVALKFFSHDSMKTVDMLKDSLVIITEEASDAGSPVRVTIVTGNVSGSEAHGVEKSNSAEKKQTPAKPPQQKKKGSSRRQ